MNKTFDSANKKYDVAVLIGRFQPLHVGHIDLMKAALGQAHHLLIVLGSVKAARNLRNPFNAQERTEMLSAAIAETPELAGQKIKFLGVRDYFYNNSGWKNEVVEKVNSAIKELGLPASATTAAGPKAASVALIGFEKDFSSSYLTWFPDWHRIEVTSSTSCNATPLRENYLRDAASAQNAKDLAPSTKAWLAHFAKGEAYKDLHHERTQMDAYKKSWASAPFPPVFVTTDVLLVCADHLLMIQRKHAPGRGLWANPGGFLDPNEMIQDCAIRELYEETAIDVPEQELRDSVSAVRVFDHPLRSSRGRTITHAHLIKLKRNQLPKMKASDDAADAKWVPLMDVFKMEEQLFEDHFHIIMNMLKTS